MRTQMMNTSLVLLLLLSTVAADANSARPHRGIEKGVILGYHNTHWEAMRVDGWRWHSDSQIGVSIGGFVGFPIGRHLVLQPQLLYTDKRERQYWGDIGLGSRRFELPAPRYLELPILTRWHLASIGGIRFQFIAGPMAGIVISDLIAQDDGGVSDGEKGTLGWGVIAGLSVGLGPVMLDIRRSWEWYASDEPQPLHNRTLAFTLGLNIRSLPIR